MYNLQYSGIVTSKIAEMYGKVSLDGLIISTETNPYYQYFDPYFVFDAYELEYFDEMGGMRFLFMSEYICPLPTKIAFLENTMYRTLRLADKSYNYRIFRFLRDTL